MRGGAYMRRAYTWSKTSVKEKEGTYLQETGGGTYRQRNTVCSPICTSMHIIFKFSG